MNNGFDVEAEARRWLTDSEGAVAENAVAPLAELLRRAIAHGRQLERVDRDAELRAARRRGAEEMRERAAKACEADYRHPTAYMAAHYCCERIRALPLSAEK